MEFIVTMLSWSFIEYGKKQTISGELGHLMEAIQWNTDYFLKAHIKADVLYGEVGDGDSDHYSYQRPEDMSKPCQAYRIDANNPSLDIVREITATMDSTPIVFKHSDHTYSNELLNHSKYFFSQPFPTPVPSLTTLVASYLFYFHLFLA